MSIPPAVYILKCPHLGHISASNVCWDCACDQNIARLSTDHMMNERNLVTASWFLFFFLFMSLGCVTWYWTRGYFCPSHLFLHGIFSFRKKKVLELNLSLWVLRAI